jgi:hypothetical protein
MCVVGPSHVVWSASVLDKLLVPAAHSHDVEVPPDPHAAGGADALAAVTVQRPLTRRSDRIAGRTEQTSCLPKFRYLTPFSSE